MNLQDQVRYGILLDFYGGMLTARQREVLDGYLNYNESLAEIAGEGATRQAMSDLVRRSLIKLDLMEKRLGMYEKYSKILERIPGVCAKYEKEPGKFAALCGELEELIKTFSESE